MKEEGRKEVEAGVDLERRANRGGDSGEEKRACSKSSLRRTEEEEAEARAIQLSAFLLHPPACLWLPCCTATLRFWL